MNFKLKAFTLSEIMVALTVIGILTAILLPIVANSIPDKKVMKFKKADTTLKNVIRELVNSDKYYADGDLGTRRLPDGTGRLIDGTNDGDVKYFCQSIAEIMSVKKINCSTVRNVRYSAFIHLNSDGSLGISTHSDPNVAGQNSKMKMDDACKTFTNANEEIKTTDNVVYYQTNPAITFGIKNNTTYDTEIDGRDGSELQDKRIFAIGANPYIDDCDFNTMYKIVCVDIDGIPSGGSENCDDVKDICPFGYGIRADGKILSGARADAWLAKDFQGNDPSEEE